MVVHRRLRGTTVYLYFNYNKKEFWISTGIRVNTQNRGKNSKKILQKILQLYKEKLEAMEFDIQRLIVQLEVQNIPVTREKILQKIRGEEENSEKRDIVDLFDDYLKERSSKIRHVTYKKIKQTREKLRRWQIFECRKIDTPNFDKKDFVKFSQWLQRYEDLGDNTIAVHCGVLKNFLRHSYPGKRFDFIKFREIYVDVIYLYPEELKVLQEATLKGYLDKTRDLFLIGCYTGLRYADYEKVNYHKGRGNVMEIIQRKTGRPAYPPFTSKLEVIMAKYNGKVPIISNQNFNVYLKALFRMLDLEREVIIHKRRNGQQLEYIYPLWDVISSHVARKTFIMTLLTSKVDQKLVMEGNERA